MTLEKLYRLTAETLNSAGSESAFDDALWLMEAVLGVSRSDISLDGDKEISDKDCDTLRGFANRLIGGEPLQYITGYWQFYGRKFYVGEGVLIPRDDTEVVVRSTLQYLDDVSKSHPPRILDLCSGSGIIAITLKCLYPKASVTAVEISPYALPYLRRNAEENKADIEIIHGDIFEVADAFDEGMFDLIISNPPYIRSDEMNTLQSQVLREPKLALEGGEDGCDFYRRIIPMYRGKLKRGGMLAFELDGTQAQLVGDMMTHAGYGNIRIFDDLGGIHRAINGTLFE